MTTKKIDQLPAASAVTADDLVPIVDAPGTSPVTQKATAAQLNTFIRGAGGPLTATDISSNTSSLAFNDAQASVNTVIKGTTDANLVVVDASNNRVGIGTSTPTVPMEKRTADRTRNHDDVGSTRARTLTGPPLPSGGDGPG